MSVTPIATGHAPVTVTAETVIIHDLRILHAEAAAFVRAQLTDHGPDAAADLVRRALPVGLVALSMGTAGIDTGSLSRTLDVFADTVTAKAELALTGLDQTLVRLRTGEEAVGRTATAVLQGLPAQVEAALAGQAGSVRASVAEATRAVQAAGLQDITTALARHSESVRDALSLDREGPVQTLRTDVLAELNATRRELSEQLSTVRGLVEATQAATAAGAKSSRAIGIQVEADVLALCEQVALAAGDLFERTGDQAGPGTTRRTGDGVATLSPAVTGHGGKLRLVIEAKSRSRTRALSVRAYRDEITAGCQVREAHGGLVVVPTRDQVPGDHAFCRVSPYGYVVSAEDRELVSLIYLLLREHVAMTAMKQDGGHGVDLTAVEARISVALTTLDEFDEVGRLAVQAERSLAKLREIGKAAQARARAALISGKELLHT